jgi:hypothetical protein
MKNLRKIKKVKGIRVGHERVSLKKNPEGPEVEIGEGHPNPAFPFFRAATRLSPSCSLYVAIFASWSRQYFH